MVNKMKKKGWIRILEAVFAIFLISIIALLVTSGGTTKDGKFSVETYNAEVFILRAVQLNNTLRQEITGTNGVVYWDSGFPINTKNEIMNQTPSWLDCMSNICPPGDTCLLTDSQKASFENRDIYAESILVNTAKTPDVYNPRELKLFCIVK